MTALAKLLEKWLEDDDCSALEYAERLRCADELEAALSPAELGGVEDYVDPLDVFLSQGVDDVPCLQVPGRVLARFIPGSWDRAYEMFSGNTPTPRAAEAVAVDDPMIYRFRFAYEGCPIQPSEHERVRIALTASLTPPAAKGENNNV